MNGHNHILLEADGAGGGLLFHIGVGDPSSYTASQQDNAIPTAARINSNIVANGSNGAHLESAFIPRT